MYAINKAVFTKYRFDITIILQWGEHFDQIMPYYTSTTWLDGKYGTIHSGGTDKVVCHIFLIERVVFVLLHEL